MTESSATFVVVVDDSVAARDLLVTVLESAPGVHVVGTAVNGEEALRLVKRLKPDVVTMDVRMPRMDGLEATRRIMREMPTRIILIDSDAVRGNMDLTFEALKAGALTVVRKPNIEDPDTCKQLIETVRLMAGVSVVHHWGRRESSVAAVDVRHAGQAEMRALRMPRAESEIEIIGMAASTGGPTALAAVLGTLPPSFPLPILVVQHITPGFGMGMAEWLKTKIRLPVRVAVQGERPQAGVILVAPDDYHMEVRGSGVVELSKTPPYKGLRPSANPLFMSMAKVFGSRAMGIILTGMGDDGVDGLEALHRQGGTIIAQDESTSVVYGMPREAVVRGVVDRVLSLDHIALTLAAWRKTRQVGAL